MEQPSYTPTRGLTLQVQPPPQTNLGVLEHSGIPVGIQEAITDIPPDLSWMTEMQLYQETFEYGIDNELNKEITSWYVHCHDPRGGTVYKVGKLCPWNYLPFLGSKWWTGTISFKMTAIKPPRVGGKLLIRYWFWEDHSAADTKRRCISKEWDLSQSQEFEFDVPAINPLRARPTWIPRQSQIDTYKGGQLFRPVTWRMPLPSWWMGIVSVEAAQRLQPGGIFPDKIRINVFRVYKDARVYVPVDFRGRGPHMLTQATDSEKLRTPGATWIEDDQGQSG